MDQALPTQFDNTASVWDHIPQFAAMQAGQQNAIAENNNAALQRAYQGEQDFLGQKRPMDLLKLAADTGLTNAHTGYYQGLTDETGLKNQYTRGTMDSSIGAGNAKNAVSQGNDLGQIAGQLYTEMQSLPEGIPSFIKAKMVADRLGITHPELVSQLISHADHIPDALSMINNGTWDRSPEGRKEFQAHQTALAQAGIHSDTMKEVTGMQIDAGRWANKAQAKAVDLMEQVKLGKLGYEKAATAFQMLASMTDDPDLAQQYAKMAKTMEDANLNQKNAQGGGKLNMDSIGEGEGIKSNAPKPSGIGTIISKKATTNPTPIPIPTPAAGALKYSSPQGQDWVKRAMQANPGMSEADIIMQGRQRGKLVD